MSWEEARAKAEQDFPPPPEAQVLEHKLWWQTVLLGDEIEVLQKRITALRSKRRRVQVKLDKLRGEK